MIEDAVSRKRRAFKARGRTVGEQSNLGEVGIRVTCAHGKTRCVRTPVNPTPNPNTNLTRTRVSIL